MTWQDLKNVARYTYEQSRDTTYDKLQERKQKLAEEREKNKDNVPFQIGRAFIYVLGYGAIVVFGLWLLGLN